jgi:hypothetical protein
MMIRAACIWALLPVMATIAPAADDKGAVRFKLPSVGGWVITADSETLIVSVPIKNQLVYFDTVNDKELKRVEVGFQPAGLALQGKTLFAAAKGASLVYALDAMSGSESKKVKLPGDPVLHLACNPETGPVYASTAKHRIVAIDPESGKAVRTKGRGLLLAADPKGTALYAGMIEPYREPIKVTGGKDGSLAIEFDNTGRRATVLKYVPAGKDLKLVDGNANAASGAGGAMSVSPDGQRLVFVAADGWTSKDRKERSGPVLLGTDDLKTIRGAIACEAPRNITFHPVLSLGVVVRDAEFCFFNARTLAVTRKIPVSPHGRADQHNLLTFGGKGTKLIHLQGENLSFIPMPLTEDERAALTEVYGRLPEPKNGT